MKVTGVLKFCPGGGGGGVGGGVGAVSATSNYYDSVQTWKSDCPSVKKAEIAALKFYLVLNRLF